MSAGRLVSRPGSLGVGMTVLESHAQTERVQVEVMRRLGGGGRGALLRAFSRTLILMNSRAFLRAHPQADEREAKIAFVATHYGVDLARRYAEHLRGSAHG